MISSGQTLLPSLGWALINSLWQMALLWVVYNLLFAVYRNAAASGKSLAATLFVTTGFAWFIYTFINHAMAGVPDTILTTALSAIPADSFINKKLFASLPVLASCYLLLILVPLYRFSRNYSYVRKLKTEGLSKIHYDWRIFVNHKSAHLGISKQVSIFISELVHSPVTIGFLKPVILVPLSAINNLSPAQMEAVLLHELAHIRRYDYIVNLWLTFVQTILYFNPFVRLFIKNIDREREKSCDELVLHFQYDPHGYASALLMFEKNHLANIAMAVSGKKIDLLHRIEAIFGIKKSQAFSVRKLAGIFAGLICIIALQVMIVMSKPLKIAPDQFALLNVTHPLYFFSGGMEHTSAEEITPEIITPIINNAPGVVVIEVQEEIERKETRQSPAVEVIAAAPAPPPIPADYIYVNSMEEVLPELSKQEEEQVEAIVNNSKMVLEKAKWNEIEKDIADALTSNEKHQLHKMYMEEMKKIDWKEIEKRIKISSQETDLEKMNLYLHAEMNKYKLDSIVQVYTETVSYLTALEKIVKHYKKQEIIHPEICISQIQKQKKQIESETRKLKAIRDRKIISL